MADLAQRTAPQLPVSYHLRGRGAGVGGQAGSRAGATGPASRALQSGGHGRSGGGRAPQLAAAAGGHLPPPVSAPQHPPGRRTGPRQHSPGGARAAAERCPQAAPPVQLWRAALGPAAARVPAAGRARWWQRRWRWQIGGGGRSWEGFECRKERSAMCLPLSRTVTIYRPFLAVPHLNIKRCAHRDRLGAADTAAGSSAGSSGHSP